MLVCCLARGIQLKFESPTGCFTQQICKPGDCIASLIWMCILTQHNHHMPENVLAFDVSMLCPHLVLRSLGYAGRAAKIKLYLEAAHDHMVHACDQPKHGYDSRNQDTCHVVLVHMTVDLPSWPMPCGASTAPGGQASVHGKVEQIVS